jgi:hypothetical protein
MESAIQNIENYTYYEFSNTDGPIEVGPVTSDNLNFSMRWTQPDTAKQCHKNAKIIYDKIRSEEDALLASDKTKQMPGLTMIQLNYINNSVKDFAKRKESLVEMSSVTMPPNSSTELTGYFVPTISGLYKFTPTTEGLIWVGDVACYEFLPENVTVGEIPMTANRYYYMRFQAKNSTTASSSMTIAITCNSQRVSDPKFVTLTTNGSEQYVRKLLYYGLVQSENPRAYYCYFNNGDNYSTILNYKGINMQQPISKIIPSDYNAPPRRNTQSFAENETVKLNVNSNLFDTTIRSATYGTTSPYTVWEPKPKTVPETDPDKLSEKYTFTENRDVPTNKTRYIQQSYIEKVPYQDSKLECYQPATTQSCDAPVCTDNIIGYEKKQGKCAEPVCTPNITGYQQKQGNITGYQQKLVGYQQKEECSGYNWKTARYNKNCKKVDDKNKPIYTDDTSKPNYGPNVNDETKPIYGTPSCAAPVCEQVDDRDKPIYGPKNCAAPVCRGVVPAQVCTTVPFTNYKDETKTKNVPEDYTENVSTPFSEERSRPKDPVPTKEIIEQVPRTIDPIQIDVTDTVSSNITGGFTVNNTIFGNDPVPGQVKTLTVNYRTMIKESAKTDKEISINDKCEVVVSYKTANVSGPIFAPSCSEKMVRLNNDGSVSVSGAIWIENPLPKEEQEKLIQNPEWVSSGISNILNVGSRLDKLVSQNGLYMLEFSASKGLLYKYCLKTFFTDTDKEKTKGTTSPKSFFLYRPSYSELGGKKFVQNQNKELVRILPDNSNLVFSGFSSIGRGYPTSLDSYSKYDNVNCAKKCEESRTCGNYVTGPKNVCYIDTNTDTNPTYISRSKMSGYNIYTKQYNMNTTNGPKPFETKPSGMYSEYAIIPDSIKKEGFESNIAQNLTGITELLNQHNQLKKKQEGFSDIPARFSKTLPEAPDTSVEEGRIEDLQEIMFQQNMMYSIGSIAAVSFLVGAIVLARN